MNWGDFLPNIGKGILSWLCNKLCPKRGSDSAQSVQGSNTGSSSISVSGKDNSFSLRNSSLDNSQNTIAQYGSGQNQMIQGDITTYNIYLPPEIAEKFSSDNRIYIPNYARFKTNMQKVVIATFSTCISTFFSN